MTGTYIEPRAFAPIDYPFSIHCGTYEEQEAKLAIKRAVADSIRPYSKRYFPAREVKKTLSERYHEDIGGRGKLPWDAAPLAYQTEAHNLASKNPLFLELIGNNEFCEGRHELAVIARNRRLEFREKMGSGLYCVLVDADRTHEDFASEFLWSCEQEEVIKYSGLEDLNSRLMDWMASRLDKEMTEYKRYFTKIGHPDAGCLLAM